MLIRLNENNEVTDIFRETEESVESELSNNYLKKEVEWRLTESLNPEESFDEDYGNILKLTPAYINRLMLEYRLSDFIDWDKLDNVIEEVVRETNNEIRKELSR